MVPRWITVASLSIVALGGPEDARFRRLSSLDDAQGLSKIIAKHIRCDVCEVASTQLAGIIASKKFKNEENVLEEVADFCEGGEHSSQGTEDFGNRLEKKKWTVHDRSEHGWALEPPSDSGKANKEEPKEEKGDLWGGFAKREGIKQACMLSVNEHQSELSEWLFTKVKKKKLPSAQDVSKKLCHELSGLCKKK